MSSAGYPSYNTEHLYDPKCLKASIDLLEADWHITNKQTNKVGVTKDTLSKAQVIATERHRVTNRLPVRTQTKIITLTEVKIGLHSVFPNPTIARRVIAKPGTALINKGKYWLIW